MKELKSELNEPSTKVYSSLLVSDKIFEKAVSKFTGHYAINSNDESYVVTDWAELINWINDGLKNNSYDFYGNVYQSQNSISTRGLFRG